MEEELDRANSDLSNLLASASLPIFVLDADLRVRLMTPAARKTCGLLSSDIGRPLSRIRLRLPVPRLARIIREVLRRRRPRKQEIRDARGNWYTMWVRPYRVGKKRIDGVVIALVDITARRRSEQARARLAMIMHDSSDAVIFFDKRGKITAWNRGAERMYGWSEAEALKMGLSDLCPKSARKKELDIMRRFRGGLRSYSFEALRKTKGGRLLNVSIIWTPIRDEYRRFAGTAATVRDITDQKRSESRRLETLVEGAPSASLIIDDSGRIALANRKSEVLFGFRAGELIGRKVGSLLPPRIGTRHSRLLQDFLRARRPVQLGEERNLRGMRRDGSSFPIEANLIPVTYRDRRAVMAHIIDISERRRAQEAEALRSKEAMHRELIANASHEMRTPVTAIKGFAEALRNGALADPKTGPKFLRVIGENADQLAKMVDDLLELSAIESGFRRPRRKSISLRRFVLKEMERLAELARRREVSLRIRLAAHLKASGDSAQLRHVLQNLIGNAIQYNRPGGFVEVSARRAKSGVRVCVRDNGIGIPKSQLQTVFERFQRTRKAAAAARGMGLGLSIARAIVSAHGGKIWAEKTRDGGTAMIFTLCDSPSRRP